MAVQALSEALIPANATMVETESEYLVDVDVSGIARGDLDVEI